MPETLIREDFAARLNETFRLDLGTDFPGLEALELALIKADPIETGQDIGDRRAPFSLVFRGPMEPLLNQSIYKLDNEAMGHLEIFLVPIGPDSEGQRYEAVFN